MSVARQLAEPLPPPPPRFESSSSIMDAYIRSSETFYRQEPVKKEDNEATTIASAATSRTRPVRSSYSQMRFDNLLGDITQMIGANESAVDNSVTPLQTPLLPPPPPQLKSILKRPRTVLNIDQKYVHEQPIQQRPATSPRYPQIVREEDHTVNAPSTMSVIRQNSMKSPSKEPAGIAMLARSQSFGGHIGGRVCVEAPLESKSQVFNAKQYLPASLHGEQTMDSRPIQRQPLNSISNTEKEYKDSISIKPQEEMMDTPPRRSNSMGAIRKPARDGMRPTSTFQTNPRQYHSSTNISAQAGPFNVSYRNDSNKLADGNRYNNNIHPKPQIESREHIRNNPLPPPPRSVSLQHPSRRRAVSALYPTLQKHQPPPPPTRSKHFGVIQCFQHPKMAQNALLSKLFPVNPVFRELVLSYDPIQGVLTLHPRQPGSTMQEQFEIGKANGPFQGVYDDSVSEKSLAGMMKLEGVVVGRVDGISVLTLTGTIVSVPKTTNRVRFRSKGGGEGRIGKWSIWFDDYKSLERWEQVIQGQRF